MALTGISTFAMDLVRHPRKSPPLCDRCGTTAARWLLTLRDGERIAICDDCLKPNERKELER